MSLPEIFLLDREHADFESQRRLYLAQGARNGTLLEWLDGNPPCRFFVLWTKDGTMRGAEDVEQLIEVLRERGVGQLNTVVNPDVGKALAEAFGTPRIQ